MLGNKYNSEQEKKLIQRAKDLEDELRIALNQSDDIKALKLKCKQLIDQLESSNQLNARLESEKKQLSKKSLILTDHIEKIMFQLRIQNVGFMKERSSFQENREKLLRYKKTIKRQNLMIISAKR